MTCILQLTTTFIRISFYCIFAGSVLKCLTECIYYIDSLYEYMIHLHFLSVTLLQYIGPNKGLFSLKIGSLQVKSKHIKR